MQADEEAWAISRLTLAKDKLDSVVTVEVDGWGDVSVVEDNELPIPAGVDLVIEEVPEQCGARVSAFAGARHQPVLALLVQDSKIGCVKAV